jgi:hypothetical protein
VLDAHRASLPGAERGAIERVAAVEPLAESWRDWLREGHDLG